MNNNRLPILQAKPTGPVIPHNQMIHCRLAARIMDFSRHVQLDGRTAASTTRPLAALISLAPPVHTSIR